MSARQQIIYEVRVESLLKIDAFTPAVPALHYFSNLKKTIETLQGVLATLGWPIPFNYTAVYRQLGLKERYNYTFKAEGVNYFTVTITKRVMNPHLTNLGIEEMPTPRAGKK